MLKLSAGFTRKVGEPDYGSRGASVNVEIELESGLIDDPDALRSRIQHLFGIVKRSVDAELGSAPLNTNNITRWSGHPGNRRSADRETGRYATESSVGVIRGIANRRRLDPTRLAAYRFRRYDLEELASREASSVIDGLYCNRPTRLNAGG